MIRWCIRLTHLTLFCEVIRYCLVQVWQNLKKKKKKKHTGISTLHVLCTNTISDWAMASLEAHNFWPTRWPCYHSTLSPACSFPDCITLHIIGMYNQNFCNVVPSQTIEAIIQGNFTLKNLFWLERISFIANWKPVQRVCRRTSQTQHKNTADLSTCIHIDTGTERQGNTCLYSEKY